MKTTLFATLLLMFALSAYTQDFDAIFDKINTGIDILTEDQERQNFNNILTKVQEAYKPMDGKLMALSNFDFYRNNGKFIYAYSPVACVVFMFFVTKQENKDKLYAYMVRINNSCKDCLKYVETAHSYNYWVDKWKSVNNWSELQKTLYAQGINNYIRDILMFNPQYLAWIVKHEVK